jgi:hypothetical protein
MKKILLLLQKNKIVTKITIISSIITIGGVVIAICKYFATLPFCSAIAFCWCFLYDNFLNKDIKVWIVCVIFLSLLLLAAGCWIYKKYKHKKRQGKTSIAGMYANETEFIEKATKEHKIIYGALQSYLNSHSGTYHQLNQFDVIYVINDLICATKCKGAQIKKHIDHISITYAKPPIMQGIFIEFLKYILEANSEFLFVIQRKPFWKEPNQDIKNMVKNYLEQSKKEIEQLYKK